MSQKSTDTEKPYTINELDKPDLKRDWDTLCHKIGKHQWTCTKEECHCHLKEKII